MKPIRNLAIISVTALVFQQIAFAAPLPPSVIKSTVFILGVSDDGSQIGRASGVIISAKGDVATNRHVVEDEYGYSTQNILVVPTGANEALNFKCAWKPTKYVPSTQFDLAVLQAPTKLPCAVDYLSPVNDLAPTGTDIRVVGYPAVGRTFLNDLNISLTTVSGQIAGRVNEGNVTTYQKTDAKIISGNSGGPVVDENNRLIGLAAAHTTTDEADTEILGLIVPAMHISTLFSGQTNQQSASGDLPPDVDASAWFTAPLGEFISYGHIQKNIPFRPSDKATRSEFIDLLVKAKGGANGQYQTQSFKDVPMTSSSFAAFEEAGLKGWVKGTGDCYGKNPCYAKPNDRVNRAEAAALLNRAFSVSNLDQAPKFSDNPEGAWYHQDIQIAADHCVLKGDSGAGTVRPGDSMNRAEMVAMISRITKGQTYINGCGEGQATTRTNVTPTKSEVINDPSKNPNNACKAMNAAYDSSTGKCACLTGTRFNKAGTTCVAYEQYCKDKDINATWDDDRETCVCSNGTEPNTDGTYCIASCEATYGYASYRNSAGQCTCMAGYIVKNGKCEIKPYCGGGTFNETTGKCNCSNGYYEKADGSCGVTPYCGDGVFDYAWQECVCNAGASMKAGGYCSKY